MAREDADPFVFAPDAELALHLGGGADQVTDEEVASGKQADVGGRVPWQRDQRERAVAEEIVRGRERADGRPVQLDEPRLDPRRPVLGQVPPDPTGKAASPAPLG